MASKSLPTDQFGWIREADQAELPKRWQPGQPLPRRIRPSRPPLADDRTCPFGPRCIKCNGGYHWSAAMGKHALHKRIVKRGAR